MIFSYGAEFYLSIAVPLFGATQRRCPGAGFL
jgi:hypothetical protein